jgi:hypothetical protein
MSKLPKPLRWQRTDNGDPFAFLHLTTHHFCGSSHLPHSFFVGSR